MDIYTELSIVTMILICISCINYLLGRAESRIFGNIKELVKLLRDDDKEE